MRILVTNDDGVRAPGIAALAGAAAATGHEVVVVAPLVDYSGAGAAVGPVHSRDGIDYETHALEGLVDVPAYGIDGPPALAAILACVGAFGPRPDLVLSGINHGANVGRSAMHSGTIGAALTAAHFGLRGLAVSIRFGEPPVPWATPAALASALVEVVAAAPPGTVLNLNTPDLPLERLAGVRRARLATSGTIRSAVHDAGTAKAAGTAGAAGAAEAAGGADQPHVTLPPGPSGTLRLDLAPPGHAGPLDTGTDAGLLSLEFATVTALQGVREAADEAAVVDRALETLLERTGLGAGPPDAGALVGSAAERPSATQPPTD